MLVLASDSAMLSGLIAAIVSGIVSLIGYVITAVIQIKNGDKAIDAQKEIAMMEKEDIELLVEVGQFSKETEASFLRGWLGRMLFSGEEAEKPAKVLSGGEKVRCMLARMMLMGGNFLIMDEPTNHLDLESITALNTGMKKFEGNIIFSTHDEEIMSTVANRIIRINSTKEYDKNISYEDYIDEMEGK